MSTHRHPLRVSWLAWLATGVWLLSSCGGGVGDQASSTGNGSGVGSGGTGSYTNGPISGLGSIIVNGVRYDVGQATVRSDGDGTQVHDSSELGLGMQVEVSSGAVVPATAKGQLPTAVASEVRFASALVGPVDVAPDAACNCLTVLGQKVVYSATTTMPGNLAQDDVVEVFGQPDLSGKVMKATRVQLARGGSLYKLVGWVGSTSDIDTRAKTVTIHGPTTALTVHYSDADKLGNLGDDESRSRSVRVWLSGSAPTWVLDHLTVDRPLVSDTRGDEARLEGLLTSVLNDQGLLAINGTVADAADAPAHVVAILKGLSPGDRVRVEGQMVAGVLKVREVDNPGSDEKEDVELHGQPSDIQPLPDGIHATMQLRGLTVVYVVAKAPKDLASLSCVEVESSGYDSQGRLVANVVKADDSDSSCHH